MEHFRNPRSVISDSIMPALSASRESDFEAMTAHPATLTTPPEADEPGKKPTVVFCARCHGEEGAGDGSTTLFTWILHLAI